MAMGKFLGLILTATAGFAAFAQTVVEEHWSPYNYPREIPEDTAHHIIMDGDTLWDIAGQYLGDPLLWPQVYEQNSYIEDPNLIYPGDPIFLNVGVVVDESAIASSVEGEEGAAGEFNEEGGESSGEFTDMESFSEASEGEEGVPEDQVSDRSETIFSEDDSLTEFVILPAGDRMDMECSTYLYAMSSPKDKVPADLIISGSEYPAVETHGLGEVVYLNKGMESGVQPGSIYSVRRVIQRVDHPKTGRFMGKAVDQIAKVRVVAAQANNATGIISESCQEVRIGDFLVPYVQEPIPLITELPTADRWEEFQSDGYGTIVYSEDKLGAFANDHICIVDLGIQQNVAPGDVFIIFRENPNNNAKKGIHLPNIYMGHGVALKTDNDTTVMKVIETFKEIMVGYRVVPISSDSFVD